MYSPKNYKIVQQIRGSQAEEPQWFRKELPLSESTLKG